MNSSCSSLQGNDITGEIPKAFGNLTSLTMLNLENNSLSGEIPSSLGNIKSLRFLYVILSALHCVSVLCTCQFVLDVYH